MWQDVPLTIARTCWMLGFQVRFVLILEWLTLLPWTDFLLQISQTLAKADTSTKIDKSMVKHWYSITLAPVWQGIFQNHYKSIFTPGRSPAF
jgi:hypothetical protein